MNSAFVGYEELGRSWRVLSTSADNRHNTLLDRPNSSFPTQPHSLIPNYIIHWLIFARFYSFPSRGTKSEGEYMRSSPAEHHGLNLPIPQNLVITRPYTASDRPSAPQAYQCLLSHFLATLGAQEKADCTSMLSSIDSCQNRVSADQYHLTVSRAQVSTHRGRVFFEVIRWQVTSFQMIAGSSLFFSIHMKYVVFYMCRTISQFLQAGKTC